MTLILGEDVVQVVSDYHEKSNQIVSIKILRKPINVTITQVFTPTTEAEDNIESFTQVFKKKLIPHQNKA